MKTNRLQNQLIFVLTTFVVMAVFVMNLTISYEVLEDETIELKLDSRQKVMAQTGLYNCGYMQGANPLYINIGTTHCSVYLGGRTSGYNNHCQNPSLSSCLDGAYPLGSSDCNITGCSIEQ